MEIRGVLQTYEWGKKGPSSKVAELYKNVNAQFKIDGQTPYAELWLGTHINGPAEVPHNGRSLLSVIRENPSALGDKIQSYFGTTELPFLFKVLSIQKALSIQVHPDKANAESLHLKFPHIYKDSNHKPELAIALTPFEALCGFRPYDEIKHFFKTVPELRNLVGPALCDTFSHTSSKEVLKQCFQSMMNQPHEVIQQLLDDYFKRTLLMFPEKREEQLCNLVERLHSQFPYDVGCFAVFFLNYLKLLPMEAIFLEANLPHAYLSGDCIECMACSDNVIRAGLTPKYKDVDTLCTLLNYDGKSCARRLFCPTRENKCTSIYRPPVPDFAVAAITTETAMEELPLITRDSASIILVVAGNASMDTLELIPGSSLFIPAMKPIILRNVSGGFQAFQAVANV